MEEHEHEEDNEDDDNDSDDEGVEWISDIPQEIHHAKQIIEQMNQFLESKKKQKNDEENGSTTDAGDDQQQQQQSMTDFVSNQSMAIEMLDSALDIYQRVMDQVMGDDDDEESDSDDDEEDAGDDEESKKKEKAATKKEMREMRESIETAQIAIDFSSALLSKLKMENSISMFGTLMKVLEDQQQEQDEKKQEQEQDQQQQGKRAAVGKQSSRKIFAFADDEDNEEDDHEEEGEENNGDGDNNDDDDEEEEEQTDARVLTMTQFAKTILSNKLNDGSSDDDDNRAERQRVRKQCVSLMTQAHFNSADVYLEHDAFDMAIAELQQALSLYDDIDDDQQQQGVGADLGSTIDRQLLYDRAMIHSRLASAMLFKDDVDMDVAMEHYEQAEQLMSQYVDLLKKMESSLEDKQVLRKGEQALEDLQIRIQELKQSEHERREMKEQERLAAAAREEANANKPVHILVPKRKRPATEEKSVEESEQKKAKLE